MQTTPYCMDQILQKKVSPYELDSLLFPHRADFQFPLYKAKGEVGERKRVGMRVIYF